MQLKENFNELTEQEIEEMVKELIKVDSRAWYNLNDLMGMEMEKQGFYWTSHSNEATLALLKELQKQKYPLRFYKNTLERNKKSVLLQPQHFKILEGITAEKKPLFWQPVSDEIQENNKENILNMGSLTDNEIEQLVDEICYYDSSYWNSLSMKLNANSDFQADLPSLYCSPRVSLTTLLNYLRKKEVPFKYYKGALSGISAVLTKPVHNAKLSAILAEEIPRDWNPGNL